LGVPLRKTGAVSLPEKGRFSAREKPFLDWRKAVSLKDTKQMAFVTPILATMTTNSSFTKKK
jgi:hypothetical protein